MSTPTAVAPPLTAADRCDRCGAQAKVRAIFVSGDLLFCGHHGHALRTNLDQQALEILVDAPTPA